MSTTIRFRNIFRLRINLTGLSFKIKFLWFIEKEERRMLVRIALAILVAMALMVWVDPKTGGGILLLLVGGWCMAYLLIELVWLPIRLMSKKKTS